MIESIEAQALYDLRERDAQISGADLHELFRRVCYGEPSPPGEQLIRVDRLIQVMQTTTNRDLSQFIQDAIN